MIRKSCRNRLLGTSAVLPLLLLACGGGDSPTGPSNVPTPTPLPALAAPTGLTATAGVRKVDLAWTASAGATGYKIIRGGAEIGQGAATTYSDAGVSFGTQYCYTVRAADATRTSADSAQACATPLPSYDGRWSGTTSQGQTVSFTVASNVVNPLSITAVASGGGCTVTTTANFTGAINISNNAFQLNSSSWTIRGTFSSESAVSGTATYTVTSGVCSGLSTSFTWTAAKS